MPQFDISFLASQIFWLSCSFGILYFLVSRFILPRVTSTINKRTKFLNSEFNLAEEYDNRVDQIEKLYQSEIHDIDKKISDMHMKALKSLDNKSLAKENNLSLVISKKEADAVAEINNFVEKFNNQKIEHSIRLAEFIVKKVTNSTANKELLKKITLNNVS